jgi:hypothetical protein
MSDTDDLTPTTHHTHTAWSPHFIRGKFAEWVKVGRGYIETDEDGNQIAHIHTNAIVRGDVGFIRLMPVGKKPPHPTAQQPKRPQQDE